MKTRSGAICRAWQAANILGALAMTEPGAGSDAAGIRTTARRDGDLYILNGSKIFITLGGVADTYIVTAVTDAEKAPNTAISAISLWSETRPVCRSVSRCTKWALRHRQPPKSFLIMCASRRQNLLGQEGDGFKITMDTLDGGRVGIAAQAIGIARSALEDAVAYASERKQFGKSILDNQGLQFMIADMATEIDAARLLTLRAAYLRQKGIPCARESAMAKLKAGDMAMKVTTDALQIFGGYGYTKEYPAERHMRDAKITQIYEGTQQVQRMVIARNTIKALTQSRA